MAVRTLSRPSLGNWRRPAVLAPLAVVALWIVSAAVEASFGWRITQWQPDEYVYTRLAMGIAHQLSPFTTDTYGVATRLNQLYPLLIAPLWGPLSTVSAFRLTHVWNAILITSATVPTYLLAREVLGSRLPAVGAAALVAVMPWLTIATAELTEVAAFPACAWALLAMQRCLDRPSPGRDVVALLAMGLATYARLQLGILAVALVVAMIVHELGAARLDGDGKGAWRSALTRIARRHAVLSALTVLGIVVGVPLLVSGTLASAFGFYGDTLSGITLGGPTFSLARAYLSAFALGLGGVPVAMAVGFVLSTLVAPLDRRSHAFASLTLATVVLVVLQVAELVVRYGYGALQERYCVYIVPLLVVGMFAAALRTRRPGWAIASGAIVTSLLVATTGDTGGVGTSSFWFQISPATAAFQGWIVSGLGAAFIRHDMVWAALAIVLLAALVVELSVLVGRGVVLAGLTALALLFCGAETLHSFTAVVVGTPTQPGLGAGNLGDANWVDRSVPRGARAFDYLGDEGGFATSVADWENLNFWNRRLAGTYGLRIGGRAQQRVSVDPLTGRLALPPAVRQSGSRLLYAVTSPGTDEAAPVGVSVARSPDHLLQLVRLAAPARVRYLLAPVAPRTFTLGRKRPTTLRVYPEGPGSRRCVGTAFAFAAGTTTPKGEFLELSSGRAHRRVPLVAGKDAFAQPVVCAARPGGVATLSLRTGVDRPGARPAAPVLLGLQVGAR